MTKAVIFALKSKLRKSQTCHIDSAILTIDNNLIFTLFGLLQSTKTF